MGIVALAGFEQFKTGVANYGRVATI